MAVLSFLPHLVGRNIFLHEDSHALCYFLAGMTSRSPEMMGELRRLWYMLGNNNINMRPGAGRRRSGGGPGGGCARRPVGITSPLRSRAMP
jgi:hypothetical protein